MMTEKETAKRAEALNRAAEGIHALTVDARKAGALTGRLVKSPGDAALALEAGRAVYAVGQLADGALTDVLAAGGKLARIEAHMKAGTDKLDLSDLSAMSSDEARELLSVLDHAQELAERVDAQRGRCVGPNIKLQPGESRGTDYAEAISNLALRLRGETLGPVHAGRE